MGNTPFTTLPTCPPPNAPSSSLRQSSAISQAYERIILRNASYLLAWKTMEFIHEHAYVEPRLGKYND